MTATTPARAIAAAALVAGALAGLPVDARQDTRSRDARPVTSAGTATLAGIVVDAGGGNAPVRRAIVRLGSEGTAVSTVTDASGRFVFNDLPAGRFSLAASKPAWITAYHGAPVPGRAPGLPIALDDGEAHLDVVLSMVRGAVISGRIVDEFGAPVADLPPVLMRRTTRNGRHVLATIGGASRTGTTDGDGRFRIYGLEPGTYILGARGRMAEVRQTLDEEVAWITARASGAPMPGRTPPERGRLMGLVPVYYPGTADVDAAVPITVGPGEERSGLDLALLRAPMAGISGRIVRPDGGRPGRSTVHVISTDAAESPLQRRTMRAELDPGGAFELPAVLPGRYQIWARSTAEAAAAPAEGRASRFRPAVPPAADMDLWATAEIAVSGQDINGLVLTLQPGLRLSGEVRIDPLARGQAEPSSFRVQLSMPEDVPVGPVASHRPQVIQANFRFELPGVPPGPYVLDAFGPPGWVMQSVVVDGADVLDRVFELREGRLPARTVVTMTDRVTTLTGTLTDGGGAAASGYRVFVFSTDPTTWRVGSRRITSVGPDADGNFTFAGLPPGEYFVAALADMQDVEWASADVLEQFAALALRVTLIEGETTTQHIRIAR